MIKSGSGTAAESLLIFVGKGLHKVPENIPPSINHIKDILNIINNLNNNIFLKMLFCIALTQDPGKTTLMELSVKIVDG